MIPESFGAHGVHGQTILPGALNADPHEQPGAHRHRRTLGRANISNESAFSAGLQNCLLRRATHSDPAQDYLFQTVLAIISKPKPAI